MQVDKDLKEDSSLTSVFPGARVLLCTFHVLKWFNTKKTAFDLNKKEQEEAMMTIRA